MTIQGNGNILFHRRGKHTRAAQIPTTLARNAERQMARSRFAVLHLAGGRQAKSLLRTFVRLHLWHGNTRSTQNKNAALAIRLRLNQLEAPDFRYLQEVVKGGSSTIQARSAYLRRVPVSITLSIRPQFCRGLAVCDGMFLCNQSKVV